MTSEQLYHVLGLQGYQMVATWYEQGRMVLEVESIAPHALQPMRQPPRNPAGPVCPGFQSPEYWRHAVARALRGCPGGVPVLRGGAPG